MPLHLMCCVEHGAVAHSLLAVACCSNKTVNLATASLSVLLAFSSSVLALLSSALTLSTSILARLTAPCAVLISSKLASKRVIVSWVRSGRLPRALVAEDSG